MDISGFIKKRVEYFELYPDGSDSTTGGSGIVVGAYIAPLTGIVHLLVAREFDDKIKDMDFEHYSFYLKKYA